MNVPVNITNSLPSISKIAVDLMCSIIKAFYLKLKILDKYDHGIVMQRCKFSYQVTVEVLIALHNYGDCFIRVFH